ncbi:MAG: hypothetical protein AABZ45_10420 [Pseudomonadota bacterium]
MTLDKTEATGLSVAIAAHIILFALLSFQLSHPDPHFDNPPMAVEIIAEAAPVATAPEISDAPPAARLGDPDSDEAEVPPPRPIVEPPKPPKPVMREAVRAPRPSPGAPPQRRVVPTPERTPARQTSAQQRSATRPVRDPRPSGALDGIAAGVARDARPNARSVAPPAAQSAAAIRADIRVSINAEVRGPWNGCRVTGVDVDQLKTTIVFRLTEVGGLERIASVNTSGVNDSNRPQVQRFEECARRAIQLAAPFANLPQENYSYWQTYTLDFEKR